MDIVLALSVSGLYKSTMHADYSLLTCQVAYVPDEISYEWTVATALTNDDMHLSQQHFLSK